MSDRARAYWRLLNSVEDYFRYGERAEHDEPGSVRPVEEVRPERAARAAEGGEARAPRGRAGSGAASQAPQPPSASNRLAPDHADGDDELAVRRRRLAMLEERVHSCTRCPLHEGRMKAVPGQGVFDPLVMVIGEGPGADEDRRGLPFVGRAGQFLDKWLEAIDLDRSTNAYIGNIVKCRPPNNRDPRPNESEACLPYLREQIELIRPQAVLTVGRVASGILIGTKAGIGSLRGRTFYYNGIPLIPTYHPSGVLRNPELKRPVWEDLKRLRALIERERGGGGPGDGDGGGPSGGDEAGRRPGAPPADRGDGDRA